jgi:hypothetical protein
MAGPQIVTRFLADTSRMTADVDSATTGMGSKVKDFAKGAALAIGGAFAATAVVDFAKESIAAASDLEESISKIGVVFGNNAKDIRKWASGSAESMGISEQAALSAAGTYGNLAVSLGLPQDKAADMSKNLVQLAADMSSFNNVPVEDALAALQSGLTGETEPLKKFGVNLNEAALKAKAVSMGLSDGKGVLDASAKAQASYALIMEQSTTAQGDFARTSDGLANRTKISAAKMDDLKAAIGERLLPVMNAVVGFIADDLLPAFQSIGKWIADNQDLFMALGAGLAVVGIAVASTLVPAFLAWAASAAAAAVATLAAAAPFIAIGAAVAAVAFVIIKNWDTIKSATKAVWDFIVSSVGWAIDRVGSIMSGVVSIVSTPFRIASDVIGRVWDSIKNAASSTYDFMVGVFGGLAHAITAPVKLAWNALASIWNNTAGAISISIPGWVPVVGGNKFDVPDLPKLAAGGVLTSATLFVGGEAGTEIVAPESMLRAIVREESAGGGHYELNIYPRTADSSDIAYGFRRLELLAGQP